MDSTSGGKSGNSSFSIRYNANNEELEEVLTSCDEDPPTPHSDPAPSPTANTGSASPRRFDKSGSIIDKYFKSIRTERLNNNEKQSEGKEKTAPEDKISQKDVNSSPMKEYLNRLSKRGKEQDTNVVTDGKDVPNETWKIFQDFKVKIAQAVEDMKPSRGSDEKEKSVPRTDSSVSDSEENSAARDADPQSVGDTDNQVSSLHSSIHNLSEQTQPVTAKVAGESWQPDKNKTASESSDDTHKLDDPTNKDLLEEDVLDVESGIEALEESNLEASLVQDHLPELQPEPDTFDYNLSATYLNAPVIEPNQSEETLNSNAPAQNKYFLTIPMTIITVVLFLSYSFATSNTLQGFMLGIWTYSFFSAVYVSLMSFMSDASDQENREYFKNLKNKPLQKIPYVIPSIKEHTAIKKYEGWINHYRFSNYDPYKYNVNKTTTAFIKLEGSNLRLSYTRMHVSKKATWDEKLEKIKFYQHHFYSLSGARVILLPKGLVQKRIWSKKYPICVILNDRENVEVIEKDSTEKKDGSPEKSTKKEYEPELAAENSSVDAKHRRKFWRKKERESAETLIGKPGIRHRLSLKTHRDKKTEDASTSTDPVQTKDEDLDSANYAKSRMREEMIIDEYTTSEELREYIRIRELLDEAEEMDSFLVKNKRFKQEHSDWSVRPSESLDLNKQLFIFTRTSRDKHEWYRRIQAAIADAEKEEAEEEATTEDQDANVNVFKVDDKEAMAFTKIQSSVFNIPPEKIAVSWGEETLKEVDLKAHEKEFWPYMYKIIQSKIAISTDSQSVASGSSAKDNESIGLSIPTDICWLNAAIGRIVYDVMRNPALISRVQRRVQRKLNTLKLPAFIGSLLASEMSLGSLAPQVQVVSGPTCDERGVWLDADIRYDGGAFIAINTKIDLMKLNEKKPLEEQLVRLSEEVDEQIFDRNTDDAQHTVPLAPAPPTPSAPAPATPAKPAKKSAIYHSDVDDSAESSSDDEPSPIVSAVPLDEKLSAEPDSQCSGSVSSEGSSGAKKFLRMVDKIAASRYFQQISDYKVVKRAMEGLSNTDIRLHLELKGLEGRLAINMPPPPHDRVWVGFRANPRIWLKARPALGTRAVRIGHITNWIEQKLCKEFEKVLVLPNMEDIQIELLTPTPVEFE